MDSSDHNLWRRVDAFQLDDPDVALTFTQRLARENGWEHAFARRVVDEYKRFIFLAMTADHQVTPSDEVDQAWHLHLTYTRSYWNELCGQVLGRSLHHGPTKGGKAEGDRFEDQYERTLVSYRKAFGEEPPADIWPPSAVRFGEAPDFVRVNRQRVWTIHKPWRQPEQASIVMFGIVGFGGVGFLANAKLEAFDRVPWFWICVGIVGVIALVRALRNKGGPGGSGCAGLFGCGGDSGCGGGGCGGG